VPGGVDRSFQICPPVLLSVVISPNNDLLGIKIKDIRPRVLTLQISVVDNRHLLFINVYGGTIVLIRGRDMQVAGYLEEKLWVLPDQIIEPDGRLSDKARRVGVFVVGFQRSGKWGMEEDNCWEILVAGEQRGKPGDPLFGKFRQMTAFQVIS
jgi:hypothetical protein